MLRSKGEVDGKERKEEKGKREHVLQRKNNTNKSGTLVDRELRIEW